MNLQHILDKARWLDAAQTNLEEFSIAHADFKPDDNAAVIHGPPTKLVLVTSNENYKKRLCIDYSQTIKKFTLFDGYPLPRMQNVINKVSQYRVSSTLDLKNAYHQVELPKEPRIYTAFDADGQFFQFTSLSFGLKNAVSCFQRIIDRIIKENDCEGRMRT